MKLKPLLWLSPRHIIAKLYQCYEYSPCEAEIETNMLYLLEFIMWYTKRGENAYLQLGFRSLILKCVKRFMDPELRDMGFHTGATRPVGVNFSNYLKHFSPTFLFGRTKQWDEIISKLVPTPKG